MPGADLKNTLQNSKPKYLRREKGKLAEGKTPKEVISIYRSFNISKSQITKWKMAKDKIIAAVADRKVRKLTKIRPAKKHKELYRELLKVFQETRSKGRHVDFNWIYNNARKITRELTGATNAIVKQHTTANFIKRYNLKNVKSKEINGFLRNTIAIVLRNGIPWKSIRTGATDTNYHKKWGSFLPHQRLNVDQSPLPFARQTTMAYEEI